MSEEKSKSYEDGYTDGYRNGEADHNAEVARLKGVIKEQAELLEVVEPNADGGVYLKMDLDEWCKRVDEPNAAKED